MDDPDIALDFLRQLLENTTDINAPDQDWNGMTRLHRACYDPDVPMVRMLVTKLKANVHVRDNHGRQPLHLIAKGVRAGAHSSAKNAHTDIMKILLDAEADLEAVDSRGKTPLALAICHGRTSSARFLMNAGANTAVLFGDCGSKMHRVIIDFLRATEEVTSVNFLLTMQKDVGGKLDNGLTPLERAAWLGSASAVKALLRAGEDPNAASRKGRRALHWLAELIDEPGGEEVVRNLLDAGADVNAQDTDGTTPLLSAMWMGSPTAVLRLLQAGASPKILGKHGDSPLHHAWRLMGRFQDGTLEKTALRALQALIDAQLDMDQPDKRGWRPLHKAAYERSPEAVRVLRNAGAALSNITKNISKLDIVECAVEMLRYSDGDTVVDACLHLGASPNTVHPSGVTLLHLAVGRCSLSLLNVLINAKVSV